MLDKKLIQYRESQIYPFHMPGHKRVELDFPNPYSIDITEIDGFDNLHHPREILKEAQQRAADLYGARKAYYLINGSTGGLLAAISAAVPKGGKILVSRNCHKAVYHGMFLRELQGIYLYPEKTSMGIQGQIQPETVREKLATNPDAAAILITSPTYDGVVSDVAAIAQIAHEHGIPLIVDQAHGAHFGFCDYFPENALQLGADVVIVSIHKTLPSFTQTALLFTGSQRVSERLLEKYLGIYETSSPSYILMAGMEKCIRMMQEQGTELFQNYKVNLEEFYRKTKDLKHLKVLNRENFLTENLKTKNLKPDASKPDTSKQGVSGSEKSGREIFERNGFKRAGLEPEAFDRDLGKILIFPDPSWMNGEQLHQTLLNRFRLQMEMVTDSYVIAMTSLMDTPEGLNRLADALTQLDGEWENNDEFSIRGNQRLAVYQENEKIMEIAEAQEKSAKSIPLEEAAGKVAAESVFLYPPGIPIIVPGERISEKFVADIKTCLEIGLEVQGLTEENWIQVVNFS